MVTARKDESFDELYRRFKKEIQNANIILECKKREHFMNKREKQIWKEKNRSTKRKRSR